MQVGGNANAVCCFFRR